jgi:hypothetical protein
MSDEYLLEIERWIQLSAQSRHTMVVSSVYWRRKSAQDQRGTALKSSVPVQIRRDASVLHVNDNAALPLKPALHARTQAVEQDEVDAFRRALQNAQASGRRERPADEAFLPTPESHSDFSALSETQYGKL